LVPLLEIKEGVGEIEDVFVTVDVGHGGKSKSKRRAESGKISTEDDGDNQGQTTSPYISSTGLQSSPLSPSDLSKPLSFHQTLNPDGSS